jgi:DNA-binding NtrC family response regulator
MKRRILVVEDETLVAWLLREKLEDCGFEVVGVASTEDAAVALSRREHPEVAIVDVRLKRGSGIAAAEEMARDGVGVLFMTGHGHGQVVRSGVGMGVIEKPFRPETVVQAVQAVTQFKDTGRMPDWAPPELKTITKT